MALFVLSSKDGWVNIMYTGLDAVGVDMQVRRGSLGLHDVLRIGFKVNNIKFKKISKYMFKNKVVNEMHKLSRYVGNAEFEIRVRFINKKD